MAAQTIAKRSEGYGYKYADIAEVNKYIEAIGETYYQYIETDERGNDYIYTVRCKDDKEKVIRGCKVVPDVMKHSVQGYGSGLTYARRYSLYMAYGLACDDDDAATITSEQGAKKAQPKEVKKPEVKTITSEQAFEIHQLLEQCGFSEALTKKFLASCSNAKSVETIPAACYQGAVKFLKTKLPQEIEYPEFLQ